MYGTAVFTVSLLGTVIKFGRRAVKRHMGYRLTWDLEQSWSTLNATRKSPRPVSILRASGSWAAATVMDANAKAITAANCDIVVGPLVGACVYCRDMALCGAVDRSSKNENFMAVRRQRRLYIAPRTKIFRELSCSRRIKDFYTAPHSPRQLFFHRLLSSRHPYTSAHTHTSTFTYTHTLTHIRITSRRT